MATREWKDGLLSCTLRELANVPDDAPKWIVLDGDLGTLGWLGAAFGGALRVQQLHSQGLTSCCYPACRFVARDSKR